MEAHEVLKNVINLSMSAVEVSVSTAHILSGTQEVQRAAVTMASAVEELAASIGEIDQTAQRSSGAVQESSILTSDGMKELTDLAQEVSKTGAVFDEVSIKAKDLQHVVSNLGKVVELISNIARQTNLLALNASIEAARAGDAGKGFAVVATEVKFLSDQTSAATKTINHQIEQLNASFAVVIDSVTSAQTTVKSVIQKTDNVSVTFEKINSNSSAVSAQVRELAHILSEQKIAVELLAKNMSIVEEKGDVNLLAVNTLADQTDQSVTLIEEWRLRLANEDIEDKVIYLAQADHLLWKKRLLDMAVGRSNMTSKDLTNHTLCRLGKWYYQQADEALKNMPDFIAIEGPHKDVHHQGIEAAKCFEKNKISEGMQHYELLNNASRLVIEGLQRLLQAKQHYSQEHRLKA